jgi:AcrR family transcriptional regulator
VQERGQARRKKLLEAAENLLQTVPVEQLSFKQVCVLAGVPEGSAYHFFANKYDLLTGLAAKLAQQFGEGYRAPIPSKHVSSWHDLADYLVDRAVKMYTDSPAATKIWLSGRTPPDVKLADRIDDRAVSKILQSVFDEFFVLPKLPKDPDVFFLFMELADVVLSLSVVQNRRITPRMAEEAKRAGRGYLATYLPPVLERRQRQAP